MVRKLDRLPSHADQAEAQISNPQILWDEFKGVYNITFLMTGRRTTLDMFIPADRRQALSRGETLPPRSHGAVLFADVSGFTRLTGIFSSELGPQRGAEALTQLLDPLYTELVNAIHGFRGSVIVISGDGITCWFDQDDGSRAIACAFAMQKVMAPYNIISIPGGQKIGLGIKIRVICGCNTKISRWRSTDSVIGGARRA